MAGDGHRVQSRRHSSTLRPHGRAGNGAELAHRHRASVRSRSRLPSQQPRLVNEGPEYVDAIPPEQIVTSGEVDGSRYLLIESDRTGECGEPYEGVELVEEDENLLGSEWNTTGYQYGEQVTKRCEWRHEPANDTTRYLKNPSLFDQSAPRSATRSSGSTPCTPRGHGAHHLR